MLVTVNAALDHFLQKGCDQQRAHGGSVDTVGKRAFEITAHLLSFCQIFQKRAPPEFAECMCPSPKRRLRNAISLKFVFRQHYSPPPRCQRWKKIVEESFDK